MPPRRQINSITIYRKRISPLVSYRIGLRLSRIVSASNCTLSHPKRLLNHHPPPSLSNKTKTNYMIFQPLRLNNNRRELTRPTLQRESNSMRRKYGPPMPNLTVKVSSTILTKKSRCRESARKRHGRWNVTLQQRWRCLSDKVWRVAMMNKT